MLVKKITKLAKNSIIKFHGKNRLYLEKALKRKFDNLYIIRLPSIFDKHIKKIFYMT